MKKEIVESAEKYSDTCAYRDDESWWIAYHAFIKGAKHMRKSVWHTDKEPFIGREGEQMIVLVYRNGELIFSTIKYAKEFRCFYNQNHLSYDLFRYAYIEDLMPIED